MPRVNRDLQRRMAARRERERRRPTAERRYRFGTSEPDIAPEEAALEAELEQEDAADASIATTSASARGPRRTVATARPSAQRGAPAARPFTAYRADYAYVIGDLRRIAVVIGGLLIALIVLYFILPH